MREFFNLTFEQKKKFSDWFGMKQNGFSDIHFDNHLTHRKPENRDVFQIHMDSCSERPNIWPNASFEKNCKDVYDLLSTAAVGALKSLEFHLQCPEGSLKNLLAFMANSKKNEMSQNTNFSMFRYHNDKEYEYPSTQKCMVHEDSGLITLLPRSTFPGLEILDYSKEQWIPIERYTKKNDVLVIIGLVMEKVTRGYFQATTHRVVREPGKIRYSMPLEFKPYSETMIAPLDCGAVKNHKAKERPKDPLKGNVHPAICDECGHYITDKRNKCKECDDFDLCEKCYPKRNTIHPLHSFKEIQSTLWPYQEDKPILAEDFFHQFYRQKSLDKMFRQKTIGELSWYKG